MNKIKGIEISYHVIQGYRVRIERTDAVQRTYKLTDASYERVRAVLQSPYVEINRSLMYTGELCVSYNVVSHPQRFDVGIYQNLRGDLVITAEPRDRVEMRRNVTQNPLRKGDPHDPDTWYYPKMDDIFYEMFEGGCLEFWPNCADGLAMYSGPGVLHRVYYPEGHPDYNDSDDDEGADWDKSDLWVFDDYVFRHPAVDLITKGYVIFTNAER